jgi:hypothetical protein
VRVNLDGGFLDILYEDPVKMSGEIAFTFEGGFSHFMLQRENAPWTATAEPQFKLSPSVAV